MPGMVRTLAVYLLAATSIVLLVLGGLATIWTFAWTVEKEYMVSVSAPEGLAWTLWVPHPGVTIPWTSQGSIASVGAVETPAGVLLNITGTGGAQVRFAATAIGFGSDPFGIGPGFNLTGREGLGPNATYRVWRESSDPAANISLSGGLFLDATRLDESWECGDVGFHGYLDEGWNNLPRGIGDCVLGVSSVPGLIPASLLVPGVILAILAWRRRRERP